MCSTEKAEAPSHRGALSKKLTSRKLWPSFHFGLIHHIGEPKATQHLLPPNVEELIGLSLRLQLQVRPWKLNLLNPFSEWTADLSKCHLPLVGDRIESNSDEVLLVNTLD